jgi:hypothetical protein
LGRKHSSVLASIHNYQSSKRKRERGDRYYRKTHRPPTTMSIRSYSLRPQDVVELRETMTFPQQPTPTFPPRPDSTTPIPPVAPLFVPEAPLSKEDIRLKVEGMRSTYIKASDTSLPHPIAGSEIAEVQPLMTPTSNTPSLTQPLNTHESDVTPISWLSSAPSGNDYMRPTTPILSNRTSLYPAGDFRNSSMPEVNDMKAEIMCNYLHQQQLKKMWSNGGREEGVLLKKSKEEYTSCPSDLQLQRNGLFDAVRRLNVRVCG